MGINPTPTNYRAFTFDGKSTREFGVYITGEGVFNSPERAVEMISIPGRDGEYALDQGHFNNIEVTYRAGIVSYDTTDFAEAISYFRNWLASRKGYCRLTDEYNTEEYRMAVFKNAIALEHEGLLTGEFDVTFDCKPQRYLAIGEELVEIGAWGNTETAEGEVVTIEASSDTAVKALTADIDPIQDLNGYDAPWVGGAEKNKLPLTVTDLKASNTSGTWNGNEYTISNVKITIQTDNGGNVVGLVANGQASAQVSFYFPYDLEAQGYVVNGISGGSTTTYLFYSSNWGELYNGDKGFTDDGTAKSFRFIVRSGYNCQNILLKPMIRDVDDLDATFAPYSNICPISGHDEVGVYVNGINQWDEVWESGSFDPTTGNPSVNNSCIRTKNYVPCLPDTDYYWKSPQYSGNGFMFYDANKQFIIRIWKGKDTVVHSPENARYLKFDCYVSTYNNDISLNYPSTDHEYHAYNGTTYTTTLPSTTYGGVLDVVSGLLTVTYKMIDLGDLTWESRESLGGAGVFIGTMPTDYKWASSVQAVCSSYEYKGSITATSGASAFLGNGGCALYWNSGGTEYAYPYLYICNEAFVGNTGAQVKQATSGVQLAYELATPLTYQLTPRQIELLLGENHIFADSGKVTVEYGHNPTILTNPTWFPSKPLLAVDGYGEIKFNNRSIVELENATIGDVVLSEKLSAYSVIEFNIDTKLVNVGDSVTLNIQQCGMEFVAWTDYLTTSSVTISDSNNNFHTTYNADDSDPSMPRIDLTTTLSTPITITVGTSATITNTVSGVWTLTGSSNTVTFSYDTNVYYYSSIQRVRILLSTPSITISGADISDAGEGIGYGRPLTVLTSAIGHSSVLALGNPTYIDCDIGEAYMVKDGEPISLNQYIDLGSDLPTLPSGDTEVTYDNTITKVEVQPNWWKV